MTDDTELMVQDRRQRLAEVIGILKATYGSPRHGNFDDPLDELMYIKLSQQTNHAKFRAVFSELKRRYAGWNGILDAALGDLADALRYVGLHKQRAAQIKAMLAKIHQDYGSLSLDWLRHLPIDEAIAYLRGLPGIGVKSAYCVAMYSLQAQVLPVDTHVERIACRLGLVPEEVGLRSRSGANREIHAILERLVAPEERYSFHVNAVAHGRALCLTARPHCSDCPLKHLCDFYAHSLATREPLHTSARIHTVG